MPGQTTTEVASKDSLPGSRQVAIAGLIVFLAVLGTFLPTIRNGFVSLDDPDYVTENVHVRTGLTAENIAWAFRSTASANWHPLTWISHMADCQFSGLSSSRHHFTNVFIHSVNAVLLLVVLVQLTRRFWESLVVAILFGLHPLRVESVAWVAERKDVLSTCFFLLTLWAYARYASGATDRFGTNPSTSDRRANGIWYGWALLFFVLGLLSKPMLVTVPGVLLLLDYWPLQRQKAGWWRLVREKAPFLMATAAMSIITLFAQKSFGAVHLEAPLVFRLQNALISYVRYLGKLFYPINLSVFYPYPSQWSAAATIGAVLLLGAISVLAILKRRQYPYLLVGWLWFLGTLIPVIGCIQVGVQSMADRYTYIPMVGVLLFVVWGAFQMTAAWRHQTLCISSAGAVIALACIVLTSRQINYWRESKTLLRQALATTQHNYMAHYWLGTVLAREGRTDDAISEFRQALTIRPNADVALGFGSYLESQGRMDEALVQYQEAARLDPGFAEAHYHWARTLERQGRMEEAIAQYRQAVEINPFLANVQGDLGLVLSRLGRYDEAITHFEQALRQQPDSADLHYNLANTLFRRGRLEEAIAQYEAALAIHPESADAHNNVAAALTRKGKLDDAIVHLQQAVRLRPDSLEAQRNLAAALNARNNSQIQKTNQRPD